jgi:hypothetical protein
MCITSFPLHVHPRVLLLLPLSLLLLLSFAGRQHGWIRAPTPRVSAVAAPPLLLLFLSLHEAL